MIGASPARRLPAFAPSRALRSAPRRPGLRRTLTLALVALAGACSDRAGSSTPAELPPVVVETIRLEPAPLDRTLESVGALESPNSTEVRSEIAGKVVFLDIPEGQEVPEGHLLATIDDQQARAAVAVSRARFRNAREIMERLRALRGSEIASEQDLDNARAEEEASQGELETAETILRKTEIRAPFRGVLGLRQLSLGAYLSPGSPVAHLTQTRPLHLVFGLPERYVAEIAVDQDIRGLVATCAIFDARVIAVDPEIDRESRVVRIKALVPNEDGALLPGMAATLQLTIGRVAAALTVPQEAVVREGSKRFVYVVGDDGRVAARDVSLGALQADRVEVTAGLEAGAVVVVTGQQKLAPGTPVDARPYAPIANPNLALGADGVAFGCTL